MARKRQQTSSRPLDALAAIIEASIQPGGGAYEAARRELGRTDGERPPDARPIKEIIALYAALQDARAKEDERTHSNEITVVFGGHGGSVPEEVARTWAE